MKRFVTLLLSFTMILTTFSGVPVSLSSAETEDVVTSEQEEAAADDTVSEESNETPSSDTSVSEWEYETYGDGVVLTAYNGTDTDVYAPSTIEDGDTVYTVIKLGDKLFYNNDGLNSVTLGAGITEIGTETFYDCDNMVCIVTNEELSSIGDRAFYSCDSFNSVILYDAVTSIGTDAFAQCPNLTIWCNEGTAGYDYAIANGIKYEILNPDAEPEVYTEGGVEYYIQNGQAYPVSYDSSLTSVVIPLSVKGYPVVEIREVFRGSTSLVKISLPNSIKSIDDDAFREASALTEIELPESIEKIGARAFYQCSGLKSIKIPSGVVALYSHVFSGCTSLQSVELSQNLTQLDSFAFYNCSSLSTIELPNALISIGSAAFYKCTSLKTIDMPDSVTYLGAQAFDGCEALCSVKLSKSITKLDSYTFRWCTSLTEITIPASVQSTGSDVFKYCISLTKLVMEEESKITNMGDTSSYISFPSNIFKHMEIPGSQQVVRKGVFNTQSKVEYLTLGEGITTIYNNVFNQATNLKTVLIPQSVSLMYTDSFYSGTVLYVYENSYAHNFAVENDLLYYVIGDDFEPYYTTVDGVTYLITKDRAIATGFDDSITDVVLPEYVDEKPLTQLKRTFYNCSNLKSVTLPDSVVSISSYTFYGCSALTNVNIPENVTSINEYTFYGCSALNNIELHDAISTIGQYAFYECRSLVSIDIPTGIAVIPTYAFYACTSLESVSIPASVTTVESYAFSSCKKLKGVTLPEGITTIPTNAFSSCAGLETIVIPDKVTDIGSSAFSYCSSLVSVTVPESVISIGRNAFYNCTSLTDIYLPDSLTYLGAYAFQNCKSLAEISIPNVRFMSSNVDMIGYWFQGCTSLTKAALREGVSSIDIYVFNGCTSLKELTIPSTLPLVNQFVSCSSLEKLNLSEGVLNIASGTFYACSGIESVIIPQSVNTLYIDSFAPNTVLLVYEGSYAHNFAKENNLLYYVYDGTNEPDIAVVDGVAYLLMEQRAVAIGYNGNATEVVIPSEVEGLPVTELRATFQNCETIVSVTLPDSLKEIAAYSFQNCTALENVNIPYGVTYIGDYSFNGAVKLNNIDFPNTVTAIGTHAFSGCSSLTRIHIPSSVQATGWYTFEGCTSVTELVIDDGLVTLGDYSFQNCSALTSVVIPGTVKTIGGWAFAGCSGLADVTLNNGVETIGDSSFRGAAVKSIVFPESTVYIGTYAFFYSRELKNVYISGNNVVIGERAFYVCYYIDNVTIAGSIKEIGEDAFNGCTGIDTINIIGDVELIGYEAFRGCSSLNNLSITGNITSLSGYAFADCSALEGIDLQGTIGSIGYSSFKNCSSLKQFSIPETCTGIISYAFSDCTALTEICIPAGIKTMSSYIFNNCSNLTTVKLSEGLTKIESSVFANCTKLKSVYIPASVTDINTNAFESSSIILLVNENSYAHIFAQENDLLYFVLHKAGNPEIEYGAAIVGTASYTDGTPANGATVEIFYDDGTLKESVVTDENGVYEFTYAEVGRYTVKVTDADGNTALTQLSVKRMNAFDVFLEGDTALVLKRGWTVSGSVNVAATVTVTDTEGNVIASTEAADGSYSFSNIPNGTYIIKAEAENGSAAAEITVFDGDLSGVTLTVETLSTSTIWGYVEVEARDYNHHRRNWVRVTVYDSEGLAVAHTKSDMDGKYVFNKLPLGEYFIVAETEEMRPDRKHRYDRSHRLTGYEYIDITEAGEYQVADIVLYEENDRLATVSGKVTAKGQSQVSEVILTNVYNNEVARYNTKKNGKYSFVNIPDGMYTITAVTESDGMGMARIVVRDGRVYGNTDIKIEKNSKVVGIEDSFKNDVPELNSREDAVRYRDRIAWEKRNYDALSHKEKKMLSKDYIQRLDRYCQWLSNCSETDGLANSGLVLSGDELEKESTVTFELSVDKVDAPEVNTDGIKNKSDYIDRAMHDAARDKEIVQYYDITMSKTVDGESKAITSVYKDTDAMGKFRITLEIPEEHRGHKHYTMIHEHNGEVVTLVDLDDDPNTITVEIDRFSTFALSVGDESYIPECHVATDPVREIDLDKREYYDVTYCDLCGEEITRETYTLLVYNATQVTAYGNLTDAVEASAAGDTLKLMGSVTEEEYLEIVKAITLDLNGGYLDLKNGMTAIAADVVDRAGGGVICTDTLDLAEDNPYMPMFTDNGYVLFDKENDIVMQQLAPSVDENGNAVFKFRPSFGSKEENREYFGDGSSQKKLTFGVYMKVTDPDGEYRTEEILYDGEIGEEIVIKVYNEFNVFAVTINGATKYIEATGNTIEMASAVISATGVKCIADYLPIVVAE